VSTETTHKIKNQDAKYAEAFQADVLCTDEKDVSFIKNNPVQKELVKTKNKGYEIAFNAEHLDLLLEAEDLIKIGYVKDTVANSKIDFEADTLTVTSSNNDGENETTELEAIPAEDSGYPKGTIIYWAEDIGLPLIIRGVTKITLVDGQATEIIGAVDDNGLPLYDEDGKMIADNDALFILAFYYPESMRAMYNPAMIINETVVDEAEKEHFKITKQFVEDFQADFAEGDNTKIGFIKNMPFYSVNKTLSGFTIAEPLLANEDFKLLTGTTKNSLLLDKDSSYEVTPFEVYPDGTVDIESIYAYPGTVYNRTEMLEAMQAENFAYAIPESEIAALDSVLPANCSMLALDDGDILPLIFTHIHMSIAEDGSLQVVTDENAEENYFTYLNFGGTDTLINITGKNIPENNFKFKQVKKLPSEFIDIKNSVTDYLDPYDSEEAVSGYGIWQYLKDRVRTQVLSTSDGHINFVKADDGSRNIDFSVETVGIGNNEDLKTTEKDTIVGAINELIDKDKTKLQVAASGINNIYYTDKQSKPQEQLIKQNYVTATDKHTCYEALINDSSIYWCPTFSANAIYGISTETFNIYALDPSTRTVVKAASVQDTSILDTLTQAFAGTSITCVDLSIVSRYEKWVHTTITGSTQVRNKENYSSSPCLNIYLANKQYVSIGFSKGVISFATVTDISEAIADLPTLQKTDASVYSSSTTTGSSYTAIKLGKKWTITPYTTRSYRENILAPGSTSNTGINYRLNGSNAPTTYGNSENSNLQLIIDGNSDYEIQARRALDPEGIEIYTYNRTDYTGIDNNVHSPYIYLATPGASGNNPFCLTSAGECIWRDVTTGRILARKTIQTNSSDLFNATSLKTTKLYHCYKNDLLYVVNDSRIYAINIFDENPTATVIKATSSDEFTFNDNCRLISFGDNLVLLTNGNTLKVVQIRESFDCNELKLGDTAQDKIVIKDAETGDLYNLVIKNGQVVIEAVTV
jgi:hypothetical protein